MKKYIALILSILMLTGLLFACAEELPENAFTGYPKPRDTDAPNDGDIYETEPPVREINIGDEGFIMVVSSADFTKEQRMELKDLLDALKDEYGIYIRAVLDTNAEEEKTFANEIILGNVANRSDVEKLLEHIPLGGYLFDYNPKSGRLSIIGEDGEMSLEGLKAFIEGYLTKDGELVISSDLFFRCTVRYRVSALTVEGVDIKSYTVVVPKDDIYAYYTALNLQELIRSYSGYEISVVYDDTATNEYEILIGDTSRAEDDTAKELGVGEYLVFKNGNKLVMRGYGVYVAAAGNIFAKAFDGAANSAEIDITDMPTTAAVKKYAPSNKAENVILMIGDGMGANHIDAAKQNRELVFAADSFTNKGDCTTHSQSMVTDSAASATALATGYKTVNGYIGKDKDGNNVQNVRELADAYGAMTAVITTDLITGATPSGFLAHNISRDNTEQLQNSINKLKSDMLVDYCEGDVGDSLTTHTRNALSTIGYTNAPFFMMLEEGYIDKDSHSNDIQSMMDKVERFNDAIIYAACFTLMDGNTVLVVTADHETGGLTADAGSAEGYRYTSTNHTQKNVPTFAIGAGTEIFNGKTVDNTDIAEFCAKHFGVTAFGDPN